MSNMISGIQAQIIQVLTEARTNSDDQSYPKKIKAYGGELENPKKLVRSMPFIAVNLSNQFELTAEDIEGTIHSGVYEADLILFENNSLNKEETISEMAILIDWVVDALKGKTIVVDGIPIPIAENIKGQYFPIANAAVLTLNLGSQEG